MGFRKVRKASNFRRVISWMLVIAMVVTGFSVNSSITVNAATAGGLKEGTNYIIASKKNGMVLTVEGNSKSNNAMICQMPNENYESQIWNLDLDENGYYQIINKYSGKALDIPNSSTVIGERMIQFDKGTGDNQKWQITDVSGGYCRITPKINAEYALNIEGGQNNEGALLIQWSYSGADNELWEFQEVKQVVENPQPAQPEQKKAIDKYLEKFFYVENGLGKLRNEPENGFWTDAEILEVFIDAYERLGDQKYLTAAEQLYDGFAATRGTNWAYNGFNDDIMWMVIATARLYLITGNQEYLSVAKENFELTYNRAWSTDLGGGLWWTTDKNEKNACVNGPGAVAACLLGEATKDEGYYAKAAEIMAWETEKLFSAENGKVYDHIKASGTVDTWDSTYNQGTFIGANAMLYLHTGNQEYYNLAKLSADYAATMGDGKEGYLNREHNGRDLLGFKGILGRWMGYFARECDTAIYDEWMVRNATAAWNNRNSDDLMWTDFGRKTSENIENSQEIISDNDKKMNYAAWGCSSAVAWLLNCRYNVENASGLSMFPIEAEVGQLGGKAQISESLSASNGAMIGNLGGEYKGTVTLQVQAQKAGKRTIKVYYATAAERQLNITVNNTSIPVSCGGSSWTTPTSVPAVAEVELQAGVNTILLSGVGGAFAPNIDRIEVGLTAEEEQATVEAIIDRIPDTITKDDEIVINAVLAAYNSLENKAAVGNADKLNSAVKKLQYSDVSQGLLLEGEFAELGGHASLRKSSSASNGSYIGNLGGENNGTAVFKVNAEVAGKRVLKVYYATAAERQLKVTVNDDTPILLDCSGNSWEVPKETPVVAEVQLREGNNIIHFGSVEGLFAPNIDRVEIEMTDAEAQSAVQLLIDQLPEKIEAADSKMVSAVKISYDALVNKGSVNAAKLESALKKVEQIESNIDNEKENENSAPSGSGEQTPVESAVLAFTIEAEVAALANGAELKAGETFSNGYYVGKLGGVNNGTIAFKLNVLEARQRTLKIYYAIEDIGMMYVTVGESEYPISFSATEGKTELCKVPRTVQLNLAEGENTIQFVGANRADAPNIDRIEIDLTEEEARSAVEAMIEALPDAKDVIAEDAPVIWAVEKSYNALTDRVGVKNAAKLAEALAKIELIVDSDEGEDASGENNQPTEDKEQPVGDNDQPTEDKNQPVGDNDQPTEDNDQPAEDKDQTVGDNDQPTEDKNQPVGDNEQPTEDKNQPIEGDDQPVEDDNQPAEDNNQPTEDGEQPTEDNDRPTGDEEQKPGNSQQPSDQVGNVKDENSDGANNVNGSAGGQEQGGVNHQQSDDFRAPEEQQIESIEITGSSKQIAAGKGISLIEEIEPEDASDTTLTWTSSNPEFAMVDQNGHVVTKRAGRNRTVTITAKANDGSNVTATYKIKIMPKVIRKIKIDAPSTTVEAGKKVRLQAKVTPNLSAKKINKKISWSSNNIRFATVTPKGVVKTKKAGKGKCVKITATATDGSNKSKSITIKIE